MLALYLKFCVVTAVLSLVIYIIIIVRVITGKSDRNLWKDLKYRIGGIFALFVALALFLFSAEVTDQDWGFFLSLIFKIFSVVAGIAGFIFALAGWSKVMEEEKTK